MKVKLCFRVTLLTVMLLMLVATFKTQSSAACSPAWHEGCLSGCDSTLGTCLANSLGNPFWGFACTYNHSSCRTSCNNRLAACIAPVSGPEQ